MANVHVNHHFVVVIVIVIVLLVGLVDFYCGGSSSKIIDHHSEKIQKLQSSRASSSEQASIQDSIVEVTRIQDVQVLIRTPPEKVKLKGIIIVFHGCSHGALDWGDPSECSGCVGLPEERSLSKVAIQHSMAIVAPTSHNRKSKCWNVFDDGPKLKNMLENLVLRNSFDNVPMFAFGASSGGAMAYHVSKYYPKIKAIAPQVAALPIPYLTELVTPPFPPTLLLHMSRDVRTAKLVAENIKVLKENHVRAKEIELQPAQVTAAYLSSKIVSLTLAGAGQVVSRLRAANILDENHELILDPRTTGWRDSLTQDPIAELQHDSLVADASALSEVLNVAWARHELFSDFSVDMLDWFESVGQP